MNTTIFLFYYTMLILLVVATSAASCFAIYLVQRTRILLFAAAALVFYFFDIFRLVLLGKDNQNIASEANLAPGTVKVHVHNILKKTGCANRVELSQDFWNRA